MSPDRFKSNQPNPGHPDPWQERVEQLHAKLMQYLADQQDSGRTHAENSINWIIQRLASLQLAHEHLAAYIEEASAGEFKPSRN